MQTPLFPWRPIVIPCTHYTCKHSSEAFLFFSEQTYLCIVDEKRCEGSEVISSSVWTWCLAQTMLQLPFSCPPVQTVPSLVHAIRSLWRTELNLGAAICRPGVMHMAYLACSVGCVLIQLCWTWIDLWRSWTNSPRASYQCLIPLWLTFCWQQCLLKPLFSLYKHAKSCLSFLLIPWHSFRQKEGRKDPLFLH